MATLFSLVVVLLVAGGIKARSVDQDDSVVDTVFGTFYTLEAPSGQVQDRLNRRELDALRPSSRGVQALRLDLGPEVAALDMQLSQDSVWSDDSQLVVRRGEQVEEVRGAVDTSCFLSGQLTSQDGAASLNRCGRLSGMIQTNDFHYEIEETGEAGLDDSDISRVKVTMRRSDNVTSWEDSGIFPNEDLLGEEDKEERGVGTRSDNVTSSEDSGIFPNEDLLGEEDKDERGVEEESFSKRQSKGIAAEVAVFLDANFVSYMARKKGRRTVADLTKWLVTKWNVIRQIYGDEKSVGVPFTIMLKKIEVWERNPSFYARLGDGSRTQDYVQTFCQKSSNKPNYDHKMLYTQGTGEHHMGMAYLNGVCRTRQKCSLVKAKEDDVKIELHEFGHNLGLEHDPGLAPCHDPRGEGGFMGWSQNYRFLDCYRRDLLKHIRERGASCLYEQNVNLETLNPSVKAQSKSKNRKTQQKNKSNKNKQNSCN